MNTKTSTKTSTKNSTKTSTTTSTKTSTKTSSTSDASSFALNRRMVLRLMGVQLALPLLSTVLPSTPSRAQAAPARQRFIGVFFPNGAHQPNAVDGNWNFDEALAPLVQAGHRDHAMIVRGLFNGFPEIDPHW